MVASAPSPRIQATSAEDGRRGRARALGRGAKRVAERLDRALPAPIAVVARDDEPVEHDVANPDVGQERDASEPIATVSSGSPGHAQAFGGSNIP